MDVSSYRYRSHRPDDGALRERLRALAAVRRRFGYRRLACGLPPATIPARESESGRSGQPVG